MNEIVLEAEARPITTKGQIKALRLKGVVPGIAYGEKDKPLALSVNEKSMQAILHSKGGRNALISLKIGANSHAVLIKEIQRHPITRALYHVDFQRVSLKQKIEAKVPIHVKGEAPGVKVGGGVLEHIVRELRVRCLPTEIPASVDADISNLQLNQAVRIKDLALPKSVEILMDPESVIVHVLTVHIVEETPVAAADAAAAGVAAPTEPEVIKKGKVEEGAEGQPAGKAGAAPAAAAGAPASAKGAPAKPEAKKPEGK